MNSEISYKDHMIETYRAMLDAMTKREKKRVSVEVINQYTKPEYKHTPSDTQKLVFALLNIRYICYTTFSDKKYFSPTKHGQTRWDAYLGANLVEIQEEAERRMQVLNQNQAPWDEAR